MIRLSPVLSLRVLSSSAALLLAILAPECGLAQTPSASPSPAPPLPPSDVWVGPADYAGFAPGGEVNKLTIERLTIDAPNGPAPGMRLETTEAGATPLTVQAHFVVPREARAGDVMLAHFFLRTVKSPQESGEGVTTLIVERSGTWDKSISYTAKAANGWKEFSVPFAIKGDFAPGQAHINFRVGFQKQIIEIADFEIRNFHDRIKVAALPLTKIDLRYAGMEPGAAWRVAAEKRIETLRKAPLTVQVVDAAGHPVAGAQVEVRQTRHAFGWGSAVDAKYLMAPPGPDGHNHYAENVLANFNLVTLGNDLKWPRWEADRDLPLRAAAWIKEHGLELRGHNLVWPGWRHLPADLKPLTTKPDEMRAAVLHHVTDEATALASSVKLWDVINETYDNHDLMDICGQHILVDIFEATKKADPHAALFINDYGIVTGDGLDLPHQESFYKVISYLQEQHAPVEGIGIQGHFGEEFTPPERVLSILDRFAKFGLPMQLTEFTLMARDDEADERFMRDMMTLFFSYPSMNAFVVWGFEPTDFPHQALFYDAAGQMTYAGRVWQDLVYHKWWTQQHATTAADGSVAVSGFDGSYAVTATRSGQTGSATADLQPGGTTVKIVLGP